jgi:hypothetical protein
MHGKEFEGSVVAKFETFAHVGTEEIHENLRDTLSWSRFE